MGHSKNCSEEQQNLIQKLIGEGNTEHTEENRQELKAIKNICTLFTLFLTQSYLFEHNCIILCDQKLPEGTDKKQIKNKSGLILPGLILSSQKDGPKIKCLLKACAIASFFINKPESDITCKGMVGIIGKPFRDVTIYRI